MSIQISFCTTCSNRLRQLQATFDGNARVIAANPDVEWIILDLSSQDGLDLFMRDRVRLLPDRIVYVRDLLNRSWHASVAKNMAHRLGRGRILVSLDCDNFIGDAVEVIRRHFATGYQLLHMWSGTLGDGTYGRIAIAREAFYRLGGYDESFYPMGYQDFDLVRRAGAANIPRLRYRANPKFAIPNTKEESVQHCSADGLTWQDYNRRNRARSLENVAAGRIVANQPNGWLPMKVEIWQGAAGNQVTVRHVVQ